jgi:hypothetical protein
VADTFTPAELEKFVTSAVKVFLTGYRQRNQPPPAATDQA